MHLNYLVTSGLTPIQILQKLKQIIDISISDASIYLPNQKIKIMLTHTSLLLQWAMIS